MTTRKRGRRLLLISALLGAPALACAADAGSPDFGGRIRTEYARLTKTGDDKLLVSIEPELTASLASGYELYFKPALQFSPQAQFKPAFDDQYERSDFSRIDRINNYARVELKELFVTGRVGTGTLRLGKQQIAWGAADGVRVLDVVNPVDLSNFVMGDPVDSRIALWSANYQVALALADLQLIWIPDLTFNDYPADPRWYYLTSPKIIPGPPAPGIVPLMVPLQRPGTNPVRNANYGLRLTKVIGGVDVTLNYLYHYNDDVVVNSDLKLINGSQYQLYTPSYRRSNLIGATFSFASGGLVYRGEAGYNSNSYVLTRGPQFERGVASRAELSYVLGLDWSGWKDSMISAQFYQSVLSGDARQLVRDKVDSSITFNASRTFVNQRWRAELLYIHNLNDGDSALRARLRYNLSDRNSFYAEYGRYSGIHTGLYGQFSDKARIVVGYDRFF